MLPPHCGAPYLVAACWLFSSLFFSLASGQSTGGRVIGQVADPTGAVISGVTVTLVNEATGVSRTTKSDAAATTALSRWPPAITAWSPPCKGFKKDVRSGVTLLVNQVLTLNVILQPGGAQEVVEVTLGSAAGGHHHHPARRRGR